MASEDKKPSKKAAAKKQPPTPQKRYFLGFWLGLLLLPCLLIFALILCSIFPQCRPLQTRLGSALEVILGKTPTLILEDKPPLQAPANLKEIQDSTSHSIENPPNQTSPPAQQTALPVLPNKIPTQPTWDPVRLFNGVVVNTEVHQTQGGVANEVRNQADAYQANWQVNVTIPQAAATLAQLSQATPQLEKQLPQLESLLVEAKTSRVFHEMYRRKLHALGSSLSNLGEAPYRHNFFDLNTALELESASGQKAFLLQADMDIVTDGSDGDRLPEMPEEIISSRYYQSTTSYGWRKQTNRENPLITRYRRGNEDANQQLANARQEIAQSPSENRRAELTQLIAEQENRKEINDRIIADLQARSYLIAEYDPFIVLPTWVIQWQGQDAESFPKIGDYAVVFHGGKAYPAIVGDAGPNQKVGEASLRIAREVNPEVTQYRGAVNDLGITYFIFPNSRDQPFSAPDYETWHQRCTELLQEFGGLGEGYQLHQWENTFPPLENPTQEQ